MDTQQFEITLIAAIAKSVALIVGLVAGIICIYLGWRLYAITVASSTRGELQLGSGIKIRMLASGPGIFFVAFGAWLVVNVVNRDFSANTTPISQASKSSEASSSAEAMASSANAGGTSSCALAWSVRLYNGTTPPPSPQELDDALSLAIADIRNTFPGGTDSSKIPSNDPRLTALRTLTLAKSGVVR